jgi:dihydrolipoamide dehydrogenase
VPLTPVTICEFHLPFFPFPVPPRPQALLNSSHKYHDAKTHFAHYGVMVGEVKVDFTAMQKQKDTAVAGLTKGIEGLLKKNKVSG